MRKPVTFNGHICRFGASVGIASQSGAAIDAKQLLVNADLALYRSKRWRTERAAFLHQLAEAGEAEAQCLLGQLLLDGNGVAKDQPAALAWFTRAAAQHHLMAINMVGRWAVWPVMFAIFLALIVDTWVATASLYLGLALTLWATAIYFADGYRFLQARNPPSSST